MLERFDTWPSVRVQIELCPWHWRIYFHRAEKSYPADGEWITAVLGPLTVELLYNSPPFGRP